ncbi:MSHA biogenesis protein MshI [Proteobacteria bacterium 005FR1]|nr:MSHA biogenesis protein MshI [Proteobacteria bacterium 005FR1]
MFFPWGQKHSNQLLGVEVSDEGLALARMIRGKAGLRLESCDFISMAAAGSLAEALSDRIKTIGARDRACNWVLANSSYTLLLVEAPNVPPEELRDAMRWRVKDLISFPAEQATIDIFPLPEDGSRGKKMYYVVVSERSQIQDTVELARKSGLRLQSIDIAEMALRNIAELIPADRRGLALVRLRQGAGNLVLIREGRVYLSRHFELNYNGGLLDDLPEDALVLELQRSLDYFERQMSQEPPARILFCGDNISADKITQNMRNSLPGELGCLELSGLIAGAEQCEPHLLQLCMGAIGGALRREAA